MVESRTLLLTRVAALAAGLTILIVAAVTTVGLVLAAPLGVWVVHRFQRTRGRTLGAWSSWIAAVSAATVAIVVVAGVFATRLPTGSWRNIRQATDSASAEAAKQPPPAWLGRVAPMAVDRSATDKFNEPAALRTLMMIWGLVMVVGVLGGVIGSVGWMGAMLLVFFASGRWLREPPALAIDTGILP